MENIETILNERKENLFAALDRRDPKWVPVFANTAQGIVSYGGMTYKEALEDPDQFAVNMTGIFDDMYADFYEPLDTGIYPGAAAAMNDSFQLKIAPDGTSVEHMAKMPMRAEEYPQLIEDPEKFLKEVLIPRQFPFLFEEGIDKAKKRLQAVAEDMMKVAYGYDMPVADYMRDHYGIEWLFLPGGFAPIPGVPIDTIFDCYRGFRDTQIDLRRRPDEVKAAITAIWAQSQEAWRPIEGDFPYVGSAPHIPAYLSPRQFGELYWPYYKEIIEYLHKNGLRFCILAEHKWLHILDWFRDVPKDSCVFVADDEDVTDHHEKIGDWQGVAGGAKLVDLQFRSKEENIDRAKRIIDTCAPGGGFIFTTDKPWNSPGDVTKNLVEVFNFARDYGTYR